MEKFISGNREAWNIASLHHQKAMADTWIDGFKKPGYTTFDELDQKVFSSISFKGKSVFQAPCNNGREILSFINMGATEGVGFDISDENITFSNKLKHNSGIEAEFIRTDVYAIPESYNNRFDIGVITVGSISWMPDLLKYFELYRRLLKANGRIFIYEMHPLTMVFPYTFKPNSEIVVDTGYFTKDVLISDYSLDYYGRVEYKSPPQYNFQHTMAEIIQTLIDLKFSLTEFEEFPHDIGGGHEYLHGKIPLSYKLSAIKI